MAADMNLTPPSFTVLEHVYDPILGYAKMDNDMAGYGLWPTNSRLTEKTLKVMVMGGSTSTWPLTTWSKLLCEKIKSRGRDCVIFNGAVEGYFSGQELLKVIRDAPAIKPDIVISLSGINDLGHLHNIHNLPMLHKYQAYVADVVTAGNSNSTHREPGVKF